ncbi:unnamed protein product [Clonostachys solani]|uniref:Metallo-beta-lactamase domain-containing protein n=1 Tax=Clonostachys solani TaxID=160281 RepID=A0A9N9ZM16_9HYPO|nr:unnamed protein product [Clonostachys solani]
MIRLPLLGSTSISKLLAGFYGVSSVLAQSNEIGSTNFSTWFPITEFPNAQTANLSRWQAEAQKLAGADLWADYQHRCINSAQKYPEIGSAAQLDGFIAPNRPFDSVFFVGSSGVSSWAIDTGDGLILIDALWNPDEAERIIIPGLQTFGYDGSDVKALIITHEHVDHFGGAGWLQETYGIPVYATEECWDILASIDGTPKKEYVLTDGGKLTIGNTTIFTHKTPGHTPGTVSLLIPVYDRGEPHLAGLYGGGGIPSSAEDKATQIESFNKFAGIAQKVGVDVLLSNHQTQDHSLQHFDVLANRQCNGRTCSLPNPYVVGTERYARYLKLMGLCVRVRAARINQNLRI